ncbi:MAG: hypothetical protein ACRCYY_15770 [Trueperaceae bacterium]
MWGLIKQRAVQPFPVVKDLNVFKNSDDTPQSLNDEVSLHVLSQRGADGKYIR